MKLAQIVVMAEAGEVVYEGSLTAFLRVNEGCESLVRDLREGMNTPHGRPEPALIGGGAAPAFFVSLTR